MAKVCRADGCPNPDPCPQHPRKTGRSATSDVTTTHRWRKLRGRILKRDGHVCYLCGGRADTVDHVDPVSRGGARWDERNLRAACTPCNRRKSSRPLGEFLADR